MKVFLFHSEKDKEFVQRLSTALEEAGFWLCEVEIDPGANFVHPINEVLEQSNLVWSPDAAKSAWTEQWTPLLAELRDRVRLGVILLHDYPLPPLLRTSIRFEARRDQAAGMRESLAWLRERRRVQWIELTLKRARRLLAGGGSRTSVRGSRNPPREVSRGIRASQTPGFCSGA